MESIGFKEWALVCEALGRGEQTVILRKGGIAEGRRGFAFEHREFFLLPTFFHEQLARVRMADAQIPTQRAGEIEIHYFAKVETAAFVSDWDSVAALAPLHVVAEEVVRERFNYEGNHGIHAAFVRVFRLSPPWRFSDEPRYGGCRSWVQLPEFPATTQFEPVISDEQHRARLRRFIAIIGAEAAASVTS